MSAGVVLGLMVVLAYLIGAVPFGYLVARWRGVDILRHGSGNIGATNVGRILGYRFGLLVLGLDFAKGALPTLAAWRLGSALGPVSGADWTADGLAVAAGLAAFLGHLFPVYLRFRGGKGVATGAGVVSVLLPGPALGALFAWVALICATRYVSCASLGAAVVLCVGRFALTPQPFAGPNRILSAFCLVAAALVFLRHRANLSRLWRGTENRLPEGGTMTVFARIVHLVALGLWFGTTVFFSLVVGLSLFGTFEALSEKPASERPFWFPVPPELERKPPSERFPEPLRKEQGGRVAGAAVGPLFGWYFGLQAVCAVLALATALAWWNLPAGIHRARAVILLVALVAVAAGWLLERKVEYLRARRAKISDAVLLSASPSQESVRTADAARKDFGTWHTWSLLVNLLTLAVVTAAMVLAAWLPAGDARPAEPAPAARVYSAAAAQPAPGG